MNTHVVRGDVIEVVVEDHGDRLVLIDRAERARAQFEVSSIERLLDVSLDVFDFPIDVAVEFEVDSIFIPDESLVFVRDGEGTLIDEGRPGTRRTFPPDTYLLEFNGSIKYYILLTGGFEIAIDAEGIALQFADSHKVQVGARSYHDRPVGTIQTTTIPDDLMTAVSGLGSSLKTLSPERSFPTLRGHPPLIEIGDSFDRDDMFTPPCPAIQLVVQPTFHDIATVAPLSYYLGGEVIAGTERRLTVNGETAVNFDDFDRLDLAVSAVLRHVFTLDCIVRTEGLYPIELAERAAAEPHIDRSLEELYQLPSPERLIEYLTIPYDPIKALAPACPQRAHMVEDPDQIIYLPYLLNRLSLVSVHRDSDTPSADQMGPTATTASVGLDADVQLSRQSDRQSALLCEELWIGPGTVPGWSKAIHSGYVNRLTRPPSSEAISITVVCNEPDFTNELTSVASIYSGSGDAGLDITIHQALDCEQLHDVLASSTDLFHYIGHVEDDGFVCTDGTLHHSAIDSVGAGMFMLNACDSFGLGAELIEKGPIAGIVTLADIIDASAAWMGMALGRCLNEGFHLAGALAILESETLHGDEYVAIGDSRSSLRMVEDVPVLMEVDTATTPMDFKFMTFASDTHDIGSLIIPHFREQHTHSLISKSLDSLQPTQEELLDFFAVEQMPVRLNGELRWSQDIDELV